MGCLTAEEREDLDRLRAGMILMPPLLRDATQRAGCALADQLRKSHEGVDDVTLGQVALSLGGYLSGLSTSMEMTTASNVMLVAALELTEIERSTSA